MKNNLFNRQQSSTRMMDKKIERRHKTIQESALHNAKIAALRNQPDAKSGNLMVFIGEVKTSYETLVAEIIKDFMPSIHLPEMKMDADYFKEVEEVIDENISDLNHTNLLAMGELGFDEKPLARLKVGLFLSALLFIGELLMNGQSLQVTGGNLLSSYIIGFAITCGVFLFAHGAGFLYKRAETIFKKRLIFIGSVGLVSVVFVATSLLRSQFFASHGIIINPAFFALFNVFFFIVSFIIAILLFPSIEAIKRHLKNISIKREIAQRDRRIKAFKNQKDQNKTSHLDKSKERLWKLHQCKHFIVLISKLYAETVEKMKQLNINSRKDSQVPDCFKIVTPPLDLPENNNLIPPQK